MAAALVSAQHGEWEVNAVKGVRGTLSQRKANGDEKVNSKDIDKHRADVFRLTATLTGEPGPAIDPRVKADVKQFVAAFPPDAPDWTRISDAPKATFGNGFPKADVLLKALNETFDLEA